MLLDKKQLLYEPFLVLDHTLMLLLKFLCEQHSFFLSYRLYRSLLHLLIFILFGKNGKSLCKSCNSLGYLGYFL